MIVANNDSFEPVSGVETFRTRRPLGLLRHPSPLPTCTLEPAVLLWAAHAPALRSGLGVLAAVVQQRLTTPEILASWIGLLKPLRRAPAMRELLHDLAGGSQSLAEVDGAFHVDVRHYELDVRRQRRLTTPTRVVIRCTSQELRTEPWVLAADLRALGVPPA